MADRRGGRSGEEVLGKTVVTGGDAPKILEAAEHAFDSIAAAEENWGEAILPTPVDLPGESQRSGPVAGHSEPTNKLLVLEAVGT